MIKKLFLDTEFSDLVPGAKLISIALVDEDENYFYCELTDTYSLNDCSDFVKANVLPHLLGTIDVKMTYNEAILKMSDWIENRNYNCILATDAPSWDIPLIRPMLEIIWPSNLIKDVFPIHVPFNVEQEILIKNDFIPHFALHDAIVNKRAISG